MSRTKTLRAFASFMFIVCSFALPSISLADAGKWTTVANMPTARYGLSTSVVNGKIYAIGGRAGGDSYSTVEEYDPATNTWTRKTDMPTLRNGLSSSVFNGKIYAIGGIDGSENKPTAIVEEYNPATDTWRRRADMPAARFGLSTSEVNGKIYAMGGYYRGGIGLGPMIVEEYDPVSDTWRARASMPTERYGLSACVVNGKIYAIGGGGYSDAPFYTTVEEYDPLTDTWTSKADMPTARRDLSTSVVDGIIYAIGGCLQDDVYLSTVEAYDPATDTWASKGDIMPTARCDFSTSVVDSRIYAVGGRPAPWPAVTAATEQYQPIPWAFDWSPSPVDNALIPDTWVNISWEPGDFVVSHDVYFGDSFDDVNDGLGDTFRGNQSLTLFSAGFPGVSYPDGLVRGTTYYWRVDEVNDANPDSPWKGPVWSFTIEPKTAYNPNPADGAEFVELDVELRWTAGLDAALHTVYFDDDFDEVNNAAGGLNQAKTTYTPGLLEFGKTYYWRVDELTGGRGSEKYKGEVWSFTTQGASKSPDPFNYATSVEMNATLSWIPSDYAASHQVYFGMNKEAVRNANTGSPEYKGTQMLGVGDYDPGILSWDTIYYWRVDEISSDNPDSPLPGSVWSFTTGDYFVIDDFEEYDTENKIWWAWKDGVGYADHPTEPPYTGNGTGSMVGDERETSTVSGFRIHTGRYSMPLWYDNNKMGFLPYSEATLTLTSLRDWTEHGVNTLSIWCVSDWDFSTNVSPNDDEPMYVVLNGSAVVYHDDPDITSTEYWTEWRIDLQEFADQGVDLTDVHTIGLGFGDRSDPQPGGKGLMFFDDIRLCR